MVRFGWVTLAFGKYIKTRERSEEVQCMIDNLEKRRRERAYNIASALAERFVKLDDEIEEVVEIILREGDK